METSLVAIAGQTRPFDEIIIVNDASTDHSMAVIKRFTDTLPGWVVLENEQQLGVAGAVNRGLEAATGSHIVLASADEKIMPTMCQMLADAVERFPTLKVAVSRYTEWNADTDILVNHDDRSPLGMWYVNGHTPQFFTPEEFRTLLKDEFVWLSVNTAIFERDALAEVGGFDPALRWHSDWFAMYAIAFRHGFCAVPQPLAWFRRTPHSYSGRGMKDHKAQRDVVLNIAGKLYQPAYADFRAGVLAAPRALSPFVAAMILGLPWRPRFGLLWARLVSWWVLEVAGGRRPEVGKRLLQRLRATLRRDVR